MSATAELPQPLMGTLGDERLARRVIQARLRAVQIFASHGRFKVKGTPDVDRLLVGPGGFEAVILRELQNRPVPEQVRMRRLAARKSVDRAEAAYLRSVTHRVSVSNVKYEIEETKVTPW